MSQVSSFEILSLIKGKWEVIDVVDNKAKAIGEAEHHLKEGLFSAVEVIEERYDEETGESHSFVVFNKVRVIRKTKEQYIGKERRKGKEWRGDPKKYGREQREKSLKGKKRRSATRAEQTIRGTLILLILLFLGIIGLTYIVENLDR
ncbi:MAG: hypothetical protein ISR45_09195 [Rhodospirillales bacterium]|nr:hypothetical protein [Rhodospirillales bacterium]